MKTIETKNRKILVIEVRNDCNYPYIHPFVNSGIYFTTEKGYKEWIPCKISINDKLIGKLSELTNEECDEFVTYYEKPIGTYRNYIGGIDQAYDCQTAKQSFISLLQSEEIDTTKEQLIIQIF